MPKSSDLERALQLLTLGVYVITVLRDEEVEAVLTPWLTQVSLEPPTIAYSIPDNTLVSGLSPGAHCVVNVLRAGQKLLAEALMNPVSAAEVVAGEPVGRNASGLAYLTEAVAAIECEVEGSVQMPGFRLIYGRASSVIQLTDGQPLTLRQTGLKIFE